MTDTVQTWRVLDDAGATHVYATEACGNAWVATTRLGAEIGGSAPRRAVQNAAAFDGVAIAAILAPGEQSAADLRAILDGRTTPPTEAEIVAHHAAGGFWLVRARLGVPNVAVTLASARMAARNNLFALWIPLDAASHPCAWPTVTP